MNWKLLLLLVTCALLGCVGSEVQPPTTAEALAHAREVCAELESRREVLDVATQEVDRMVADQGRSGVGGQPSTAEAPPATDGGAGEAAVDGGAPAQDPSP